MGLQRRSRTPAKRTRLQRTWFVVLVGLSWFASTPPTHADDASNEALAHAAGAWSLYLLEGEVLRTGTLTVDGDAASIHAALTLGSPAVMRADHAEWRDNELELEVARKEGTFFAKIRFGENTARGRWAHAGLRGRLWLGRGDAGGANALRLARRTQQRAIRSKKPPEDDPEADFRKHALAVVARDHYPVLFSPEFLTPSQATQLRSDEPVLGLFLNGQAKAYPISILGRHELVNDTCGGVPLATSW